MQRAAQLYAGAAAAARSAGREADLARVLVPWSDLERLRGSLARARELADQAVAIGERLDPEGLLLATALTQRAVVGWWLSEGERVLHWHERALQIRERLAPESLDLAVSLHYLGDCAWILGDLQRARELYLKALALRERLAPDSLEVAATLHNLGRLEYSRGEFGEARRLYEQAQALRERLAPESLDAAISLNGLGLLALAEGRVATARRNLLQALALYERLAPGSQLVAVSYMNLAVVLYSEGDLEGNRRYLLKALALHEVLSPGGYDVGFCHYNLGDLAYFHGELDAAAEHYRKAVDIIERVVPGGLLAADARLGLGMAAYGQGDWTAAREQMTRALQLQEQIAPDGLDISWTYYHMGVLASRQGDPAGARQNLLRALDIQQRRAPETLMAAATLNSLGDLERDAGRLEAARNEYERAVQILETQRGRLGGAEAKTLFAGALAEFYHELLSVQIALADVPAAFQTVERFRARSLVERIAERGADVSARLPAALQERLLQMRSKRRRIAESLASSGRETPQAELDRWHSELARLRAEEDDLAQEIRQAVPEVASLVYPQPLDFGQIAGALEPGTLLLAYSVGRDETFLLALLQEAKGLPEARAVKIALGQRDLAEKVWFLRGLMARRTDALERAEDWKQAAASMARVLLPALDELLARARRLLIVPDGPLHLLPFCVLAPEPGRPLVTRLPVGVVPSVTLYAQLRERPARAAAGPDWVGLGAPRYPPEAASGAGPEPLRELVERGHVLRPLPGTLAELNGIRDLLGGALRLYVGSEATEDRAKNLPQDAAVVHFACHGLLDDRVPMHSALALSLPGGRETSGEDGLLQAWEVLQDVRLDSELIVLSGCETGLGRLQGGEGLLGLTRAFFFAGARSLLVSLWPIEDRSTSVLMESFYRGLIQGLPKDEALRRAQARFLEGGAGAHPYFWAGFQLVGDAGAVTRLRGRPGVSGLVAGLIGFGFVLGLAAVRVARSGRR
jgi:CHAT domain-containing protein/tetratricopeptide (TPR) repeat protein